MNQRSPIPARPADPSREMPPANTPRGAPMPPPVHPPRSAPPAPPASQTGKIIALAVALVTLVLLVVIWFTGSTTQSTAPNKEPTTAEDEQYEEEATAPAPASGGGGAEEPHAASRSSGGGSPQKPSQLPPLQVLSVGYSATPAQRVVALRIGGALPYFLHEGDTIGELKIVSIMSDRVQVSHKGKKYEIRAGRDGSVRLPAD